MQLRHMKTVQPAAEGEGVMQRVTAMCWAPNNLRLAAVTTDRIVHLFDENGERRDKFSTKPADSKVRSAPRTSPCLPLEQHGD
jgi:intraflagellar transport protein 172